jgi:formylglycine-generating enzyme required for sulfatase activity
MGTVYEVWDRHLRRSMAMKVMHGTHGCDARVGGTETPEALVDRFLEEAQVTGQLEHPGIVPVHEVGIDHARRPFFTMQLVRGDGLDHILAREREGSERWTRERVLGVVSRACEALAYAHAKGVIHRDLKPSNIMVGRFGETYVMDWGLAKVLGREAPATAPAAPAAPPDESRLADRDGLSISPSLTIPGQVIGTPSYMPPEQARGAHELLSPASDVYAVGAILYTLLAGVPPYQDGRRKLSSRSVLALLAEAAPTPLWRLAPDAPPELVSICEKAMARSIAARYRNLAELNDDLRAYLEGRVVRSHATGTWVALRKWVARNRAIASALAVIAVLVTGSGFGFWWQEGKRVQQLEDANDRLRAEQALAQGFADRSLAQVMLDEVDTHTASVAGIPLMARWLERLEPLRSRRERYAAVIDGRDRASLLALDPELPLKLPALLSDLAALELQQPRVERLYAAASAIDAPPDAATSAAWRRAAEELAADPRFAGVTLTPQRGLVPLGQSAHSGLQEFWLVLSGERPARDAETGRWAVSEASGVVLVLLPGGTFEMGSPQAEPDHELDEVLHGETVAPCFMAAHELTQAQWNRLSAWDYVPRYPAGSKRLEVVTTPMHPMEMVPWAEASAFARRLDVALPSEVEWEYACRAGRADAYHFGAAPGALERRENVADRAFLDAGGKHNVLPADWDDGFPIHAPVGHFAPNAFGLFDMLGNVAEWTASLYVRENHDAGAAPDSARRRVVRGGNYSYGPGFARLASRAPVFEANASQIIGIRLARPLRP